MFLLRRIIEDEVVEQSKEAITQCSEARCHIGLEMLSGIATNLRCSRQLNDSTASHKGEHWLAVDVEFKFPVARAEIDTGKDLAPRMSAIEASMCAIGHIVFFVAALIGR